MKTEFMVRAGIIIVIGVVFGAIAATAKETPCGEKAATVCDTLTIFVTGNELGELRPCGCSGGQLGGFDRRATLLKTAAPEQRFILDTGNLTKSQTEQSFIKFDIILQAFSMLGYDVVGLTKQDIANIGQAGNMPFKFIGAQGTPDINLPQVYSKQMELGGKTVTIAVAAADADENTIRKAADTLGALSGDAIKIVIFEGKEREAQAHLSELEAANVVIVQTDSDEPELVKKTDKGSLVISAGRLGKYVGRLEVKRSESGGFELAYKSLAITENVAQDPALIKLYKDYQAIVKDAKLLEKYRKLRLPENLQYVGSSACGLKGCHDYEYKTAMDANHTKAFKSLVLVGSDYDPECVVCHAVGMEYKSGFITAEKTPELKDVGCEACHGPCSKHLVTAGKAKTTKPQSVCADCHTSEQSANYAGHEKEYCEKIFHWREPNALKCVQK